MKPNVMNHQLPQCCKKLTYTCLYFQNDGHDKEVSFQTSQVVNITWSVVDRESNVKYCEWAVGEDMTFLCYCDTVRRMQMFNVLVI